MRVVTTEVVRPASATTPGARRVVVVKMPRRIRNDVHERRTLRSFVIAPPLVAVSHEVGVACGRARVFLEAFEALVLADRILKEQFWPSICYKALQSQARIVSFCRT